jgi:4,5-DOPA dioxygenase extradiol
LRLVTCPFPSSIGRTKKAVAVLAIESSETDCRMTDDSTDNQRLMPALFVGHGWPMNGVEDNEFAANWASIAHSIPRPSAILCISAHWTSRGTFVSAASEPETIHDFYGFPRRLYEIEYRAPGAPRLAEQIVQLAHSTRVRMHESRGFDHGTWVVLRRMYPEANIPTLQMSLDLSLKPSLHYRLGRELLSLRREGVLIIGSGNIVHNLALARDTEQAYPWALAFDREVAARIDTEDHDALIDHRSLPNSKMAFVTDEHYLPLLCVLGTKERNEHVSHSAMRVVLASISMRCILIHS